MKGRKMLFLIPLLSALASGWAMAADKPIPPPEPFTASQLPEFRITRGAVLYQRYCTFCHGETGRGDGLNAYLLPIKPADLGDPQLLAGKSSADLAKIVLLGGKKTGLSPAMPSFAKTMNSAQAGFLVDHIRTAFKHAPREESDDSEL